MNSWKEFLEKLKRNRALPIEKIAEAHIFGGVHHKGEMFIQVEWIEYDLQNHFLGEVVRIEKEIKKCALNGEISKCDYLEGRLDFVKELAGVEETK